MDTEKQLFFNIHVYIFQQPENCERLFLHYLTIRTCRQEDAAKLPKSDQKTGTSRERHK